MTRMRQNFRRGLISNAPLAVGGVTLNSTALADLSAVAAPHYMALTIDPSGSPEIVYVTAHTAAATSATIVRAREGSTAAEWPAGTDWVHAPTVHDWYPPVNERPYSAFDDEFIAPTLDGSWTLVEDASPNITLVPGGGQLSIYHPGGDASQEFHALVKSIGALTAPTTIEIKATFCPNLTGTGNFIVCGPVFADGVTYGAGNQISASSGVITNTLYSQADLRAWTGFNAFVTSQYTQNVKHENVVYCRLTWVSANTWRAEYSGDGISWIRISGGTADWSRTMTPTHMGFWVSTYGSVNQTGFTVDHFRVY